MVNAITADTKTIVVALRNDVDTLLMNKVDSRVFDHNILKSKDLFWRLKTFHKQLASQCPAPEKLFTPC